MSCKSDMKEVYEPVDIDEYDESATWDCGSDFDKDIYKLNETYFDKDEVVKFNIKYIYFINGNKRPLSKSILKDRIDIVNQYFEDGKIKFVFNGVEYIEGKPESDSTALRAIEAVEYITKQKRKDLRSKYYIEHYDFWNTVYGEENTIIAYIYDNTYSGYSAVAGDIGSTYLAMRAIFINPQFHTFEHELGHCFGLYHTHQKDDSNGLNNITGDMVCDTYTSTDTLMRMVNRDCALDVDCSIPNRFASVLIKNIMSYTKFECRQSFTPMQIMRKRKIIETNADLRKCITDYYKLEQKTWQDLKVVQ